MQVQFRSFFFFVFIRLLKKKLTPDLLFRLQALSSDLLLRGVLASGDPSDSKLCLLTVILNYKFVANLHLASIPTQLHTMVGDIESMREMDTFTPSNQELHWHDRFGSLRPPFPCAKPRHVPLSPSGLRPHCHFPRRRSFKSTRRGGRRYGQPFTTAEYIMKLPVSGRSFPRRLLFTDSYGLSRIDLI